MTAIFLSNQTGFYGPLAPNTTELNKVGYLIFKVAHFDKSNDIGDASAFQRSL